MRAIILANGNVVEPGRVALALGPADLVVAADGGVRHAVTLHLTPDIVVGDFDSLSVAEVERLRAAGTEVQEHPRRKEMTDLEIALAEAFDRGAREITIVGAFGGRWDQTFANVQLPAADRWAEANIRHLDGVSTAYWLRGGRSWRSDVGVGDIVSLIALSPVAVGVSTTGLEYPLSGDDLHFGSTRGVSNVQIAPQARVTLRHGVLLCVTVTQAAIRSSNPYTT